jgi:2-iminoacetate synthase ThiH
LLKTAVRYAQAYFEPRRWKPQQIPDINIENTSICNSHCAFCANDQMKRSSQAMSDEIVKKTVDETIS